MAYIGQVHGHQHGTETDEHILYGGNTVGMMPVPLHPNEWLDGAVVISYSWGARGLETYFHQNHPSSWTFTACTKRVRSSLPERSPQSRPTGATKSNEIA